MAQRIWPSENDVHDTSGGGRKPTEENLTMFRNAAAAQFSYYRDALGTEEQVSAGGVLSGFDFSSGDATSIILTAGLATIEGYHVEDTSTISGTLVASMFNHVFLKLDKTADLVTGLSLNVQSVAGYNDGITPPADSILLFVFETDATVIVNQYDFRTVGTNVITGHYIGDGAATRTFDLGFRPKLVQIHKNEDPKFVANSPMPIPRQTGQNRGLFFGQNMVDITNDPELVPIIVANGFTVEDGPGTASVPVYLFNSKTFDFPNIVGGASTSTTVTVTGAQVEDIVIVQFDNWTTQGVTMHGSVTAPDTVTVYVFNAGGPAVDFASGTLKVGVFSEGFAPSLNELNKFYFFNAWY